MFLTDEEIQDLAGRKHREERLSRIASIKPAVQYWVRPDGSLVVPRWQFEPEDERN